jgi:hypothetical protein
MQAWPWLLLVLSCVSGAVGAQWDVSWHNSIGRDSFFVPPHLAIFAHPILASLAAAALIFTADEKSPRVLGVRGPLGAFVILWGALAMLTAAPFDDWWHTAYGLDATTLSPPHALLLVGSLAIDLGSWMCVARRKWPWAEAAIGGCVLADLFLFASTMAVQSEMHRALYYCLFAALVPAILVGASRTQRFGATRVAAFYTLLVLALQWLLPLFAAQPRFAPIYRSVTHFVPNGFPHLILVPALVVDLLDPEESARRTATAGVLALVAFVAVQWPFASFLASPASRNWVFGVERLGAFVRPVAQFRRDSLVTGGNLLPGFLLAAVIAAGSALLGRVAGSFVRAVRG